MGADLYISSISERQREQFEPAFQKAVRVRDLLYGRPARPAVERDGVVIVPEQEAREPITNPERLLPEIDEVLGLLSDVEDTENADTARTILLDLRSAVAGETDEPQVEDEDIMGNKYMGPRRRTLAQRAVSELHEAMYAKGYFRDSYNPTSLAWLVGFSWWNDVETDEDSNLSVETARELLDKVQAVEITGELVREHLANPDMGRMLSDPDDVAGWFKYWQEKREHSISFLNEAIQRDEAIYASL